MKTLIIGGTTHGIGSAYQSYAIETLKEGEFFYTPDLDELDVTNESSMEVFMNMYGPFDRIVYSAGVTKLQSVAELTEKDLRWIFSVNTFGLPLLMAAHLRRWPEHGGSLVAVVSDASDTPMRGSLAYCASKAAEAMAVRVLARELFPLWRVSGVSPGMVEDTAMTKQNDKDIPEFRNWTKDEARNYEMSRSILGRRVTRREVASAIHYLLNADDAVNGTIITLNGGK